MTIWPPSREQLTRPVYRAIAQAMVDAVEAGEIREGARLPPHRTLAYQLGVSVHTVSRAYEELTRLGLIRGEVGRGSYVTSGPSEPPMPWQTIDGDGGIIDLSMLVPVLTSKHEETMRAALTGLAADLPHSAYASFRPRRALRRHCDSARVWLERCGINVSHERILPTNGSTGAMAVAMMTAAMPGDMIITEELGHHTLKALANTLGLRLTGVAMDDEGLVPDAVDEAAARGARAIFVMPSGTGPTAAYMSDVRREALVRVAHNRDLLIIENDAWGPMVAAQPKPIAAIAPERTLYFTGLSKCTLPGLRIGWLVVPDRLISAARTRHLVTEWMATPLIAEIATRWITDGVVAELLEFQKTQFTRRNLIANRVLSDLDFVSLKSGMHVWLRLPETWHHADFVAHARNENVAIAASANFEISDTPNQRGVRICLGGVSEKQLAEGLHTIALLTKSIPEPALLTI